MGLQGIFFDDQRAPDLHEQLVLGDEVSALLDQRDQQIEGARAEVYRLTSR